MCLTILGHGTLCIKRVKVFLDFLHKFRGQFGAKNDLNECFKTISILKSGKSNQLWGIWNFLENNSKDFFSIFCQNTGLNSGFQRAKTVFKKDFIQKLFQVKDAPRLMILFFMFYILLKNAWTLLKLSENDHLMVLRWMMVYFSLFDQILLVSAQNITIQKMKFFIKDFFSNDPCPLI